MTKQNLLEKVTRKIVWKKNQIVTGLKYFIIFLILYFFLFGLFIPSNTLLKFLVYISTIFSFLSIYYYTFIAKNKEYQILKDIWKTYFSIISLMFVMVFSIESYTHNILFNAYQEKINYQLQIDKTKVNTTINEYENIVEKYLSGYKKEKFDFKKIFKSKDKVEEKYILWYMNVANTIMIITTLFMFLRMFNELLYFQSSSIKLSNYYSRE